MSDMLRTALHVLITLAKLAPAVPELKPTAY
jgi:hypothetical protein